MNGCLGRAVLGAQKGRILDEVAQTNPMGIAARRSNQHQPMYPSLPPTAIFAVSALVSLSALNAASTETSAVDHPTTSKQAEREDQAVIDAAIAKVYPSLVRIHVIAEMPADGRMQRVSSTGSGTIIHPDGYILTNHHVAGNASRVWVRLSNKVKVDAKVVGTDPQTDLCVIQLDLDQLPDDMKPLPVASFGDFSTLKVGDTVMAMGSPAGVSQSVTLGMVANLEMITPENIGQLKQEGESVGELVRWIGHDAVIYFGNSGGPLVNLDGEIIGINEVGLGSLGGAIPADIAKDVAYELITNGRVRRSWTGVICQPMLESQSTQKGVLVSSVMDGSPGAMAGIKEGDIITHFDGIQVSASVREHMPVFNRIVMETPVGKEVEVTYLRDGSSATTSLTTVERSKAKGDDMALQAWGMTARDLTQRSAIRLKLDNTDGVLVSSVSKSGAVASAKPALAKGDLIRSVNGQSVKNLEALQALSAEFLKSDKADAGAIVEFERKGQLMATVIELGKEPNQSDSSAAKHAWIGLNTQVITRDLASALGISGMKGVRVTQIIPGSMAEEAGFEKGDLVLKLDGMVIRAEREQDADVFETMIREYPIGESVEFEVMRKGEVIQVTCALEAAPTPTKEKRKLINKTLEFTVRETAKDNAAEAAIDEGVFVESVEQAGWASLAGLAGGDVILSIDGKPISSLDQVDAVLTAAEENAQPFIVMLVKRGMLTRFIEVRPVWEQP